MSLKFVPKGPYKQKSSIGSDDGLVLNRRQPLFEPMIMHQFLIVLKLSSEYGSNTAMLSAKLKTDWKTETDVVDERNFVRFKFKVGCGRIPLYVMRTMCSAEPSLVWPNLVLAKADNANFNYYFNKLITQVPWYQNCASPVGIDRHQTKINKLDTLNFRLCQS